MNCPTWHEDDERTAAFFADQLAQFGNDVRALNWGSRESQAARFGVLCGVGDLEGCSILDVGCGLGDLWAWLRERGIGVRYYGIDVSVEMVSRARALHPDAHFEVAKASDPSYPGPGEFDYVLASGIFYLREAEPTAYLENVVARMFGSCRRGVAFNSLSSWMPSKAAVEFHADPLATLETCRRMTPWVSLRHDYHPGDFTIYMYREPHRS